MGRKPTVFYNQRVQPDVRANVMCGETTCAIGASAYELTYTPEQFINWMRANLGGENSVSGGTSVAANQAALRAFGAEVDDSVTVQGMAAAMDAGWQVHTLIHDNNNADPDRGGPYHHFIDCYDHTAGGYRSGNPWGGRDVEYSQGQLVPAIEYVFAFRWAVAPPPSTGTANQVLLLT